MNVIIYNYKQKLRLFKELRKRRSELILMRRVKNIEHRKMLKDVREELTAIKNKKIEIKNIPEGEGTEVII